MVSTRLSHVGQSVFVTPRESLRHGQIPSGFQTNYGWWTRANHRTFLPNQLTFNSSQTLLEKQDVWSTAPHRLSDWGFLAFVPGMSLNTKVESIYFVVGRTSTLYPTHQTLLGASGQQLCFRYRYTTLSWRVDIANFHGPIRTCSHSADTKHQS